MILGRLQIVLLGLVILLIAGVFFYFGKHSQSIQKNVKQEFITPIPSVLLLEPTKANYINSAGKECETHLDCPDTCGEQTIKMYGNRSHCPIVKCINNKCAYDLVP